MTTQRKQWRRWLGSLLAVGALGAASACGSAGGGTTAQTSTQTVTPPPAAQTTSAPVKDSTDQAIAALRDYLKTNFSGASWYTHVKDVHSFAGSAVEIATDLYPDADAGPIATAICVGASGYVFSNDQNTLTGVRVAASTGDRLVLRASVSGSCRAG